MINPTEKYKFLLIKAGVLLEEDFTIVDPNNQKLQQAKEKVIVLQQSTVDWHHWSNEMRKKVKFAITPNILVYKDLISKNIKSFLLEFPIEDKYQINKSWTKRIDAIYYHGRIIPGKVSINDLKKIVANDIPIIMRGPVCKEYWIDKDIENEDFDNFRGEFMELVTSDKIDLRRAKNTEKDIISDLNYHKFYFTLSRGESFNVALQEAIACGTIPIVRSNEAYWWADHLLVNFKNVDKLIKSFNQYSKDDLDEYSNLISREIKAKCSLEAIHDKYEYQKTHDI